MMLAEKIAEERKRRGWSQEELADRLGISRQAVSKWESAGAAPDLPRVVQLADLFGVSTDYLLREEPENLREQVENPPEPQRQLRTVSMEQARTFLDLKRRSAGKIANATALCILSPAPLVLLGTMAEDRVRGVSETFASAIGLVALFGMIALAVFLFITCGVRMQDMERLEKDSFSTAPGVAEFVRAQSLDYAPTFTRGLALGTVLCIVAVVPLILAALLGVQDHILGAFTALLLLLIALGVNMMIRVGVVKGSYDMLLQEGDYSVEEKRTKRKLDGIYGAYWCVVTAIYLAWSFLTRQWNVTWIVWPVAGVLFAALSAVLRSIVSNQE